MKSLTKAEEGAITPPNTKDGFSCARVITGWRNRPVKDDGKGRDRHSDAAPAPSRDGGLET